MFEGLTLAMQLRDLRSCPGFTIMELIVVIVLLGTISVVAGPRFFGQGGFDQQFFRNDILSAVRYAQKLAVATGCQVRVNFGASSYSLKLQNGAPDCAGTSFTTDVVHPGSGASSFSNTAAGGVSVSSDVSPLTFDALGRALDSSGGVTDATIEVSVGADVLQVLVVGESGFAYAP